MPSRRFKAVSEISDNVKVRAEAYRALKESYRSIGHQKRLLTRSSTVGKKMISIGIASLISPEPFSDIVGIPLLILGRSLEKRQGGNLHDLAEATRQVRAELSNLKIV